MPLIAEAVRALGETAARLTMLSAAMGEGDECAPLILLALRHDYCRSHA